MSEPRLCKNGGQSAEWIICPEALHREVWACTSNVTHKPVLCQRPAPELRKLRREPMQKSAIEVPGGFNATTTIPLVDDGLELEVQLNVSVVGSAVGRVGVYVLESKAVGEVTLIGYDAGRRQLFVDRGRSSKLPAAPAGGGVAPGSKTQGYGVRSTETAPLPDAVAAGELRLTVYLDHSILTIFANDVAVITSRVYTSSAASAGAGVFFDGWKSPVISKGSAKAWPLSL